MRGTPIRRVASVTDTGLTVCQPSVRGLVAAAFPEQSLADGSKAVRVAPAGLVPVKEPSFTIGMGGLVPRWG